MRRTAALLARLFASLVLLVPATSWAQARLTGADLRGTVSDASGSVLAGATVTVTSLETGVTRTGTTDPQGRYFIAALPPGHYRLSAELSGFSPQKRDNVVLRLGQSADVDFTLPVGGQVEEITVVDEAVLDTGKTTVAAVVSEQQIESLPINGRNFISFS